MTICTYVLTILKCVNLTLNIKLLIFENVKYMIKMNVYSPNRDTTSGVQDDKDPF